MNMESNSMSRTRKKGPDNMAIAFHTCFVTGSLLCKGATVYESATRESPRWAQPVVD